MESPLKATRNIFIVSGEDFLGIQCGIRNQALQNLLIDHNRSPLWAMIQTKWLLHYDFYFKAKWNDHETSTDSEDSFYQYVAARLISEKYVQDFKEAWCAPFYLDDDAMLAIERRTKVNKLLEVKGDNGEAIEKPLFIVTLNCSIDQLTFIFKQLKRYFLDDFKELDGLEKIRRVDLCDSSIIFVASCDVGCCGHYTLAHLGLYYGFMHSVNVLENPIFLPNGEVSIISTIDEVPRYCLNRFFRNSYIDMDDSLTLKFYDKTSPEVSRWSCLTSIVNFFVQPSQGIKTNTLKDLLVISFLLTFQPMECRVIPKDTLLMYNYNYHFKQVLQQEYSVFYDNKKSKHENILAYVDQERWQIEWGKNYSLVRVYDSMPLIYHHRILKDVDLTLNTKDPYSIPSIKSY